MFLDNPTADWSALAYIVPEAGCPESFFEHIMLRQRHDLNADIDIFCWPYFDECGIVHQKRKNCGSEKRVGYIKRVQMTRDDAH